MTGLVVQTVKNEVQMTGHYFEPNFQGGGAGEMNLNLIHIYCNKTKFNC